MLLLNSDNFSLSQYIRKVHLELIIYIDLKFFKLTLLVTINETFFLLQIINMVRIWINGFVMQTRYAMNVKQIENRIRNS